VFDVASGNVIAEMTALHRVVEFKRFVARIDQAMPADLAVHVTQGECWTLDSPEGVCPGQGQFEYPATSVLFRGHSGT
jgi:hypothetical protein